MEGPTEALKLGRSESSGLGVAACDPMIVLHVPD